MILLIKTNLDGPLKGVDDNIYNEKKLRMLQTLSKKKAEDVFQEKGFKKFSSPPSYLSTSHVK